MSQHRRSSRATKFLSRPSVCISEPLEGRLLLALASGGKSGYSANLSTNPTIRQQQLLCDPDEPLRGSTSVQYDPSLVTLIGYTPGPGYNNNGFLGYVEVRNAGGNTLLQPLVAFLSNPNGTETGFVQVKYQLSGQAGQLQPDTGFSEVDAAGVIGVDTHGLKFALRPGVPLSTHVPYTVYAELGSKHSGNTEDFLEANNSNHTRFGPPDLSSASVTSNLRPVIVSTGGPYVINEGDSLTLHGVATDGDSPASSLIYSWDLDGDTTADVFGSDAVVTAATLQSLGLGDGPRSVTITLSVSDGEKGASAPASLTVNNVKPTASIGGADGAFIGSATLTFLATDPSAADRAAGFKYLVDWGDGTAAQTVNATANNGSGLNVTHSYTLPGTYTVVLRAVDKDAGTSDPVSVTITVGGAAMLPDPSYAGKLALFVYGSNGNDTISFAKDGGGLKVLARTNSAATPISLGTFKGFTRVIGYGAGGNDDIRLSDAAGVFFGGAGNDTLSAGNVGSIVCGGAGADNILSGNSKDLLIGGLGADMVNGGDATDILVAGNTQYDEGSADAIRALTKILDDWTRSSSYESSIASITGAAPLAPGFRSGGTDPTVFDDGAIDVLTGGNGRDWFLLAASDQTPGRIATEVASLL